jgi:hypothetical protein
MRYRFFPCFSGVVRLAPSFPPLRSGCRPWQPSLRMFPAFASLLHRATYATSGTTPPPDLAHLSMSSNSCFLPPLNRDSDSTISNHRPREKARLINKAERYTFTSVNPSALSRLYALPRTAGESGSRVLLSERSELRNPPGSPRDEGVPKASAFGAMVLGPFAETKGPRPRVREPAHSHAVYRTRQKDPFIQSNRGALVDFVECRANASSRKPITTAI